MIIFLFCKHLYCLIRATLSQLRLCFICSGKMIPADLERRILEAKQKVMWRAINTQPWLHAALALWGPSASNRNLGVRYMLLCCFFPCAGLCAFLCECDRRDDGVRSLWPPHRHLRHLQEVQHLDACGCESKEILVTPPAAAVFKRLSLLLPQEEVLAEEHSGPHGSPPSLTDLLCLPPPTVRSWPR